MVWLAIRGVFKQNRSRRTSRAARSYTRHYNVERYHRSASYQLLNKVTVDRQGACRDVADLHGKTWRVRELDMAEGNGSARRKSLIALNEMVIRRFWTFPAGWRELSDRALLSLINGPATPHPESELEAMD